MVAAFCREIKLENEAPISEGALKGLRQLASEESDLVERMGIEFWTIIGEYSRMKEEKSRQFEVLARERLGKLGIEGSSVHPNLSEDMSWKEHSREIQNSFEPQLASIREKLSQELQ